jgi:hypothetical protein
MKSFAIASIAFIVVLSGCASSDSGKLSEKESCQEAMRLMGKGTDVFTKAVSDPEGASANLITLAFEFGQLVEKTDDKSLKAILVQMQSGLKTMSNSETFFEGNSIYSNQITPLTQKCYGR